MTVIPFHLQATVSDFRGVDKMFEQAFASHAEDLRSLRKLQHARMAAVQQHFERQLADMACEFSECVVWASPLYLVDETILHGDGCNICKDDVKEWR